MYKEIIFTLVITSILITSCSDEKKKEIITSKKDITIKPDKDLTKDTFSFEDKFADQPLLLDTENLVNVKNLIGDSLSFQVSQPEYDDELEADLITINKGKSKFVLFNNDARQYMIVYSAEVVDSLPLFRNNIVIGMEKKELLNTFKQISKEHLEYNTFEIYHGDATSYIYLIFESDRLKKIVYWPYTG